jgi:hypothetical protein
LDLPAILPAGDIACPELISDMAQVYLWSSAIEINLQQMQNVCPVQATTGGKTCKIYCEALGRTCVMAQDDRGNCGLGHDNPDQTDNGCNQQLERQICVCSEPPENRSSTEKPVHLDPAEVDHLSYSPFGVCLQCHGDNIVSTDRKSCVR